MTVKQWVYNGVEFKVGDIVRVMGLAVTEEEDGMGLGQKWENSWVDDMDNALGHIFEINEIREEGAFFVEFEGEINDGGYGYPLSVLQKVVVAE